MSGGDTWMMDRVKEELKNLEEQHPSRFDYLKLELKSLISDYDFNPSSPNLLSSAASQVSSNRKRRERELCDEELGFRFEKRTKIRVFSEDRVEMVIERAKDCLRRIQLVKQSFFR